MSNPRILLVEDDADIQKINTAYLTGQGYDVVTADSLESACEAVAQHNPSLILLDVQLPDGSGFEFCEEIRAVTSVPIMFLTCFDREPEKVKGLMAGGDDYMTKPYGLAELSARVHALLRRVGLNDIKILDYPPIKIDTTAQRVYMDGEDCVLTPKEYQMLLILIKNIGRPIDAAELYQKLWGLSPEDRLKTVQVHISSLRKKLGMSYDSKVQIKTIRNVGYCFEYEKDL